MEPYDIAVSKWQNWNVKTLADIDLRLDNFRILFAYNSGKIENPYITYHDAREIFENGKVTGFTGDPRTLFELQNQKSCYKYLLEKIVEQEPLSIPLMLEVHRILTEGTYDERRYIVNDERPGEFKKHDYITGVHEVGSSPKTVEDDMVDMIVQVNSIGMKNPLIAGAYFHARFENIHPFADGNGRVGRTLLNYWLMINDYPPMIIHEQDKSVYYSALMQYDESETLEPLINFLEQQTVKTWKRAMQLSSDT